MFRKVACVCMIVCLLFTLPINSLSTTMPPKKAEESSISSPLLVKLGDRTWTFNLEKIGFDGVDPTTLNKDLFMNWFYHVIERQVNRPPLSAHFKYRAIVPHAEGRTVDSRKVEEWLDNIHGYMGKPIQLPVIKEAPALTTAKVLTLKEKKLASYSTWYSAFHFNRNTNIRLSAYAIDHYILKPGETFSFNEVIGQTTSQKGYRSARIIVQGEYREGLGGGICQTSSTLYNCADRAGLKILERWGHSKRVTYVPKDRDASVVWGAGDFKFENQLNEPILIEASATNGRVQVSVYGPKTIVNHPRYVPSAPSL